MIYQVVKNERITLGFWRSSRIEVLMEMNLDDMKAVRRRRLAIQAITHLEIACVNAICDNFMQKEIIKAARRGDYWFELPECDCGSTMYVLKEIKNENGVGK